MIGIDALGRPVAPDGGRTYPRGIQPAFAPYGQFKPVGWTGLAPLWVDAGRYPPGLVGQDALSREFLFAAPRTYRAGQLGLADPGLNNGKATAVPFNNTVQVVGLRPPSQASVQGSLAGMALGIGLT